MTIDPYPYQGIITRSTTTVNDVGDTTTENLEVYNGKMDYTLLSAESGQTAQTAIYTVCIPLTKDASNNYKIPKKDDKIIRKRFRKNIKDINP